MFKLIFQLFNLTLTEENSPIVIFSLVPIIILLMAMSFAKALDDISIFLQLIAILLSLVCVAAYATLYPPAYYYS